MGDMTFVSDVCYQYYKHWQCLKFDLYGFSGNIWGGLLIEYHTARVTVVLGLALAIVWQVGSWLRELKRYS